MVSNEFGYVKGDKVYRKGFLDYPDREIGEVKDNDEETSFQYFVNRFSLIQKKVEDLENSIQNAENKGSYLMKLLHLKEMLGEFDAIGDYMPLHEGLIKHEATLSDLIQTNRERNLEIKRGLIAEAELLNEKSDFDDGVEDFKELKQRWIRTGAVVKDNEEETENQFEGILDDYFARRKEYKEEKKALITQQIEFYKELIQKSKDLLNRREDVELQELQELQQNWKDGPQINPRRYAMMVSKFKKITGRVYKQRIKGESQPSFRPRGYGDRQSGGYGDRQSGYGNRGGGYGDRQGGYGNRESGGYGNRDGGYGSRDGGYGNRDSGGYGNRQGSDRDGYGNRRQSGYGQRQSFDPDGYGNRRSSYGNRDSGGYGNRGGGYGDRQGGYGNRDTGGYGNRGGSYGNRDSGGYGNRSGGYGNRDGGGYGNRGGGYGDRQGGYGNRDGGGGYGQRPSFNNGPSIPPEEAVAKKKELAARAFSMSKQPPVENLDDVKALQEEWKTSGRAPRDLILDIQEQFFMACDMVYQKHFLEINVRSHQEGFDTLGSSEQYNAKIDLLDSQVLSDQQEIDMFQENINRIKEGGGEVDRMLVGKLQNQKRRMKVKQILKEEIEEALNEL